LVTAACDGKANVFQTANNESTGNQSVNQQMCKKLKMRVVAAGRPTK